VTVYVFMSCSFIMALNWMQEYAMKME
jgi:hypothetical protein